LLEFEALRSCCELWKDQWAIEQMNEELQRFRGIALLIRESGEIARASSVEGKDRKI
jgi:hypothetical protein